MDAVAEAKAFELKMEGEYLTIVLDPNKNGISLLEVKLHLSEVPAEVIAAFAKKA